MRAGDLKAGKLLFQILRRRLGNARLRAKEIDRLSERRAPFEHRRAEFNAGDTLLKRRAQHFCSVDDADAVRQHKRGAVDRAVCLGILAAGLHDLRIGRDHIMRPLAAEKLFPARERLAHRHTIKTNA